MKEPMTDQEASDLEGDSRAGMNRSESCCAPDPRPWWKRFLSRFFRWHPFTPDLPKWAQDGICTDVSVKFSWADRLRILLTGKVSVRTWTACERAPGRVETQSSAVAPFDLP